jgi:NAD(P)-dependent dehydrogenase (short-subunit alcohol dehydrogenase family)
VFAAAVGGPDGWPIAPVRADQGEMLPYPVGIADIEDLSGQPVDLDALQRVRISLFASPFKSAFAAKHGIAGLTKTVALELARSKITCNCISPGYVRTPLVDKQIPNTMTARNREQGSGDQ